MTESKRIYHQQRYEQRKQDGLCTTCGINPRSSTMQCTQCREANKVRSKKLYKERILSGLCSCGQPPLLNKRCCAACWEKDRKSENALRKRRKDAGLCVRCCKPSNGKWYCVDCAAENKVRVNRKNATLSPAARIAHHLRSRYKMTVEDRTILLEKQNHTCPVCLEVLVMDIPDKLQRPVIDHDHNTGKVRGLLHRMCNARTVAVAEHYADDYQRAVEYLRTT